jgi:hypothetical protein
MKVLLDQRYNITVPPVPAFDMNESDGGADSPRRMMVTDGSLTAEERLTANWFVSCSFRAVAAYFVFVLYEPVQFRFIHSILIFKTGVRKNAG